MVIIDLQKDDKYPYIITFKKKTDRDIIDTDKFNILKESATSSGRFESIDVGTQNLSFVPSNNDKDNIAFDINDFHNPIISTYLTNDDADLLTKNHNIKSVEKDGIMYHQNFNGSNFSTNPISLNSNLSSPSTQDQTNIPWGVQRIKSSHSWKASEGHGVYVAVLDTGIYPHDDLSGNLIGGISFVPNEGWIDENGHGTHVAGTIGAKRNGNVCGVAPSVHLYSIKVLDRQGTGRWSWLINGLFWMKRYAGCIFDVANMSLGASSAPTSVEDMCRYASSKTLLVCAAGNTGGTVGAPARYEDCLAVSAIDNTDSIAQFSCRGSEIDLCAPGVDIVSTSLDNDYAVLNGTSMAAPHVSGAAALCRSTHRSLNMSNIRDLLIKHADDLGNPGKDDEYGYGRVDCLGATYDKNCG